MRRASRQSFELKIQRVFLLIVGLVLLTPIPTVAAFNARFDFFKPIQNWSFNSFMKDHRRNHTQKVFSQANRQDTPPIMLKCPGDNILGYISKECPSTRYTTSTYYSLGGFAYHNFIQQNSNDHSDKIPQQFINFKIDTSENDKTIQVLQGRILLTSSTTDGPKVGNRETLQPYISQVKITLTPGQNFVFLTKLDDVSTAVNSANYEETSLGRRIINLFNPSRLRRQRPVSDKCMFFTAPYYVNQNGDFELVLDRPQIHNLYVTAKQKDLNSPNAPATSHTQKDKFDVYLRNNQTQKIYKLTFTTKFHAKGRQRKSTTKAVKKLGRVVIDAKRDYVTHAEFGIKNTNPKESLYVTVDKIDIQKN